MDGGEAGVDRGETAGRRVAFINGRAVPGDVAIPRAALAFAYHGPAFDGYARQPDARLRTVEDVLIGRLVEIGAIEEPSAARFRSGSRTDRGVSALQSVVAFDTTFPVDRLPQAVGTRLDGLYPLAAAAVPSEFDPRHALTREYRYFLDPWGLSDDLTPAGLEAAFAPFVGTHDFSAFARLEPGRTPQRTVYSVQVVAEGDVWSVRIVGRTFLWHQVRRMVNAALAVAGGSLTTDDLRMWLAEPERAEDLDRAPAWPLVLWRVTYPRVSFDVQRHVGRRLLVRFREDWLRAAASGRFFAGLLHEVEETTRPPRDDPLAVRKEG